MSSKSKTETKSEVTLSKTGESYLSAAKSGKCEGIIMTSHAGTAHRIDIQHITVAQLQILKAKGSKLVK
jgi:hypothetical protein